MADTIEEHLNERQGFIAAMKVVIEFMKDEARLNNFPFHNAVMGVSSKAMGLEGEKEEMLYMAQFFDPIPRFSKEGETE